jgi:hypothetical protein
VTREEIKLAFVAAMKAVERDKQDLVGAIGGAIAEFQEKTGCIVASVDVRQWNRIGGDPVPTVSVSVELPNA